MFCIYSTYGIRIGVRVFNYLNLALIALDERNKTLSLQYVQLAKKENKYLNIGKNADKMFVVAFLLKEELQRVGYYFFE